MDKFLNILNDTNINYYSTKGLLYINNIKSIGKYNIKKNNITLLDDNDIDIYKVDTLINNDNTVINDDHIILFIPIFQTNILHFIRETFVLYLLFKKIKNNNINVKFYVNNNDKKFFKDFTNELKLFDIIGDDYKYNDNDFEFDDNNINGIIQCHSRNILRRFTYGLFNYLIYKTKTKLLNYVPDITTYKYIYISRRKRRHNRTKCNHRRLMTNETELVTYLKNKNFKEIFLEDYKSLLDKLYVLSNANYIILQGSATSIFLSFIDIKKINIICIIGTFDFIGLFVKHERKYIKKFYTSCEVNKKRVNSLWEFKNDDFYKHIDNIDFTL